MAANMAPELLAQLVAQYGGDVNQVVSIGGRNYQPEYVKYSSESAESGGSGATTGVGPQLGWSSAGPGAKSTRMIDLWDMQGNSTGQRKDSYENPIVGVLTIIAAAYGMNALGGALGASGASAALSGLDMAAIDSAIGINGGNAALWGGTEAAAAGGGAGGGMFGGFESIGNMAEPGYFTNGTPLDGAFLNVSDASAAAKASAPVLGGGVAPTASTYGLAPSALGGAADAAVAAGGIGTGLPAYGAAGMGLGEAAGGLGAFASFGSPAAAGVGSMLPWLRPAAGLASSLIQSNGASNAVDAQLQASREANALQKEMYDSTVARNAPFVSGGLQGFNALLDRLGLSTNKTAEGYGSFAKVPTAADVQAEPGYAFGLSEGQKAIDRKLNARGMTYSGPAVKAAARFGTDYAAGQYNNAFNRSETANNNLFNKLSGVATTGLNAANNTGMAGTNYANQAGANIVGGGDARAANSIAQGNIWGNALNQGVSSYLNNSKTVDTPQWLKDIFGG